MNNLSKESKAFIEMFGLKYPIIQAGMDGAATPTLVSAVCNAGGLGTLPLGFRTPRPAQKQIKEVQSQTNGAFLVNFVLNFPALSLTTALDAGVKNFLFSWGLPDEYMLEQLRKANARFGIQVSGGSGALRALELKPDFLVCQGTEAGGHVQGSQSLEIALKEVLEVTAPPLYVPVVAAGGITTGNDVLKYLRLGAAAVMMGTRFVATQESAAHAEYKQMLKDAKSGLETVLTVCLNKVWPNATHRLLRSNATFQMWESNGRPPGPLDIPNGALLGNRPGEHDIIALDQNGDTTWERYVDVVPVESMVSCDVNALGTFAGEGVGDINDIPTVAGLMERLVDEYNEE